MEKKKTKLIGIVLFISLLKFCGSTRSYKGKGKERKPGKYFTRIIHRAKHSSLGEAVLFFFFFGLFLGMPGQDLYT